jgi:hypothetical protein
VVSVSREHLVFSGQTYFHGQRRSKVQYASDTFEIAHESNGVIHDRDDGEAQLAEVRLDSLVRLKFWNLF